MRFDEYENCITWFKKKQRDQNDHAWHVKAEDLLKYKDGALVSCNLDLKNPNSAESLEHQPPGQLTNDILEKERRIIEIMKEIKEDLRGIQ